MKKLSSLIAVVVALAASTAGATTTYTKQIPVSMCAPIAFTPIIDSTGDTVTFTAGSTTNKLELVCDIGALTGTAAVVNGIWVEYTSPNTTSDAMSIDIYQTGVNHAVGGVLSHAFYHWGGYSIQGGATNLSTMGSGSVALDMTDGVAPAPYNTNYSVYVVLKIADAVGNTSGSTFYNIEVNYTVP